MEILREPGLRPGALQVAARLVDVERRNPGDAGRRHSVEHLREQLGLGLAPEAPRIAEPVGLVVVVVAGGEVLDLAFDRGVGDAVPVLDAGRAELDVVPGVGLLHSGVVRDAQARLVRLVLHRRHEVAVDPGELDAVGPEGPQLLDARPGRFHSLGRRGRHEARVRR